MKPTDAARSARAEHKRDCAYAVGPVAVVGESCAVESLLEESLRWEFELAVCALMRQCVDSQQMIVRFCPDVWRLLSQRAHALV